MTHVKHTHTHTHTQNQRRRISNYRKEASVLGTDFVVIGAYIMVRDL
jgi:hypothetical protein